MAAGKGRCAGCGKVQDLSASRWHITQCPDWAALYRDNHDRALLPAAEYERWTREDRDSERADRKLRAMADTDARRDEYVQRFKRPDPLED
jgi:hypothetical protein